MGAAPAWVARMRPRDVAAALGLVSQARVETGYGQFPFSETVTRRSLMQLVGDGRHAFTMLAWREDRVVGGLFAIANRIWFSNKREAVDLFFYVDRRGAGAGPKLLRRYVAWARNHPLVVRIVLSSTAALDPRLGRLYGRLGATLLGSTYVLYAEGFDVEHHQGYRERGR